MANIASRHKNKRGTNGREGGGVGGFYTENIGTAAIAGVETPTTEER